MTIRKLFSAETRKELKWWAMSVVALTLEYVFYTRYRDLSPSEVLMAAYQPEYTPPPAIESASLFLLFLLILITGGVFVWFTQRLVVKFCKWLIQTKS